MRKHTSQKSSNTTAKSNSESKNTPTILEPVSPGLNLSNPTEDETIQFQVFQPDFSTPEKLNIQSENTIDTPSVPSEKPPKANPDFKLMDKARSLMDEDSDEFNDNFTIPELEGQLIDAKFDQHLSNADIAIEDRNRAMTLSGEQPNLEAEEPSGKTASDRSALSFAAIDKNGDGVIDKEEWEAAMKVQQRGEEASPKVEITAGEPAIKTPKVRVDTTSAPKPSSGGWIGSVFGGGAKPEKPSIDTNVKADADISPDVTVDTSITASSPEINTDVSGLSPELSTADVDADLNAPTIFTTEEQPTIIVSTAEGDSNDFESVEISSKAKKVLGIDSNAEVHVKAELKDPIQIDTSNEPIVIDLKSRASTNPIKGMSTSSRPAPSPSKTTKKAKKKKANRNPLKGFENESNDGDAEEEGLPEHYREFFRKHFER